MEMWISLGEILVFGSVMDGLMIWISSDGYLDVFVG